MVHVQWQNRGTILREFRLGRTQYCLRWNFMLYAKCLLAKANCITNQILSLQLTLRFFPLL
jgi:hypothetical protein